MNFLPHNVRIKKTKKKRSKKEKAEWPLNRSYPVIAMEVENVGTSVVNPEDVMASALGDGYGQTHDQYDIDLDDEDQEAIDAVLAKARKKQSKHQNVRTWLLIASPESGAYRWVTTEEVKFYSSIET